MPRHVEQSSPSHMRRPSEAREPICDNFLVSPARMVFGTPISTKAESVKVTNDGSFVLAQTNGMERRQDRRDTRQDCRQEQGAVGADKRNCKQQGRQK